MNEELKNKLFASLDKVAEYLETTEEFVEEQAPLVVNEILIWGKLEAGLDLAFSLVGCIVCLSLFIYGFSKNFDKDREFVSGIAGGIGTVIFGLGSTWSLYSFLYIVYAPRLYVIKEVSQLLQ